MTRKLYIEFRVHFDPQANQTAIEEVAEVAQGKIYNMFTFGSDLGEVDLPAPLEVTYEVVREIRCEENDNDRE